MGQKYYSALPLIDIFVSSVLRCDLGCVLGVEPNSVLQNSFYLQLHIPVMLISQGIFFGGLTLDGHDYF